MVSRVKTQAIIILTILIICECFMLGIVFNINNKNCFGLEYINNDSTSNNINTQSSYKSTFNNSNNNDYIYLSDIEYDSSQSHVGWSEILYDKTVNNQQISVKIEGSWYAFEKGIFSHADATIVYDITSHHYNYFTAYTGLDKSVVKKSDGVKFFVYSSSDGINWILKTSNTPNVLGIGAEAEFLTADISNANYLKLVVDKNVHNGADYAVWADAKLTNSIYDSGEIVLPLSYYDEQIKAKDTSTGINDNDLELLVLQREFVRKVGQYALKRFINEGEDNKVVLEWLLNDLDNLREFILGGDPMQGSYYNALTVLSNLYKNYKSDLNNTTLLNNKWAPTRTYGELYRTMMFSVALTHDGVVGSWMQKEKVENQSDPLRRYAIFRYLHKNERFIATKNSDGTPKYETMSMFESLRVEEMRWIMYNIIDDESIIWLNDYVQTKINANPNSAGGLHTPHSYIAYTNPNYNNPVYYAEENIEYFNDLFAVDDRDNIGEKIGMWDTKYVIPGGIDHETYTLTITRGTSTNKVMKVWMNFRNKFGTGSVCGGISKSGTNIRTARGVPATLIGQPGHAAILFYSKNSDGKGYWGIDNNVGGWTVATKGERHLLGWGNQSWQRTHATVVYFHLAQDALNDYDNLVKAEENIMLAKVYQDDVVKQIQLYENAISIQPINIDAWYGLIEAYTNDSSKKEQDYYNLAKRIADKMVGYPLPMYNLLNLIKPKLTSTNYIYLYTLLENNALKASSNLETTATDKTLLPNVARVEAQFLLGNVDTTVADFSFDGENAGSIVLSSRFNGTGIRWEYSLDGKHNWKEVYFTADEPHIKKLTPDELASITEENDIYIYIVGLNKVEENFFKIDITSKPSLPKTLYHNDFENKIMGLDSKFEWKYNNDTNWTAFTDKEPDCSGDKTIEVRIKATGEKPPSDTKSFTFTKDTNTDTRKYIPIKHLSIESYSSQSKDSKRPNYALNSIDGNINTYWHTDYSENILTSGNNPYLIIKLDEPRYVSGLEFVQNQYNPNINIYAKNVKVLVSKDLNNWTEAGKLENIEAIDDLKSVHFNQSVYGQYIKLEIDTYGIFTTVSMINVYEDTTKIINTNNGKNINNTIELVLPIIIASTIIFSASIISVFIKNKKQKMAK